MDDIMLFPLSSVVLPEGKMRLRIFEPRYKRLVTQALKKDGTFGICLLEKQKQSGASGLSRIGSQVRIVDFETLEDGLLGITVVGEKRFSVQSVRIEYDGLRIAQIAWLPSWQMQDLSSEQQYLALQLQRVYIKFPQIKTLYDQCFFEDASWVSQRWLELLPLPKQQFDYLARQSDCQEALRFLTTAIEPE